MKGAGLAALLALPAAAQEGPRLFDVILEPEAGLARFRFVMPGLGAFAAVEGEFERLCAEVALPEIAAEGWDVRSVVISIADRELTFGATDPAAVQFFDGFSVVGGACVWEPF